MCNSMHRFIDLDTPILLSEDPVVGGYEGILSLTLDFVVYAIFLLVSVDFLILIICHLITQPLVLYTSSQILEAMVVSFTGITFCGKL